MRAALAAVVLSAALAAGGVPTASAAAGRPWPGRTISYHNQSRVWSWSVREAVAAWNGAGVGIRFVRARSTRNAQVVISTRRLPRVRGGFVAGRATVGYLGGRRAQVHLMRPSAWADRFAMARVAAHELGHVLGLGHTRASCALMIHAGSARQWGGCPRHRDSQWRCRLVERDDLRRARRLYGGRARPLRAPPLCFRHAPPGAPRDVVAELSAAETAAGWSVRGHLRWLNPRSESFAGVHVAYGAGVCPSRPSETAARTVFAEADDSLAGVRAWARRRGDAVSVAVSLDGLAPGSYCFAVWSTDEAGLRHSAAPATVQVTVGPPPAPPRTGSLR